MFCVCWVLATVWKKHLVNSSQTRDFEHHVTNASYPNDIPRSDTEILKWDIEMKMVVFNAITWGSAWEWPRFNGQSWCCLGTCASKAHCLLTIAMHFFQSWSDYILKEMKWNESGFRPPLCTYRLNWARRTSWGWWDDWDDTVLQTQDSKFEPWRSEAEHATSRSRRLPTILTFTRGWGRNNFCFFQTAETGNRTPDSGVKGSGANHYPRAPALYFEGQYGLGKKTLYIHQRLLIRLIMTLCYIN